MDSPLDIEFESYIIFHRGIKEVYVDEEAKLHAVYQDGYDQVLGDPVGDTVRQDIEDTKATMEHIDEVAATVSEDLANTTNMAATARENYAKMQQAANDFDAYAQQLPYAYSTTESLQETVHRIDLSVADLSENLSDVADELHNKIIYYDGEGEPEGTEGMIWLKPKTTT